MEPKFVTLPAIRICGYALSTRNADGHNNRDIPAFWQEYMRDGRCEALHGESFVASHTEYGACFSEDREGNFDYVIGVAVPPDAVIPAEYAVRTIPAAAYAVFSTPPSEKKAFTDAIQGTWNYIFAEWFPASGYEYTDGCVDFERYDERCMADKGNVCEIYLPVTRKAP